VTVITIYICASKISIHSDIRDPAVSSRLQCLAGVNHMSGRGIPKKKEKKDKGKKTARYPGKGTEIIDGMTAGLREARGNRTYLGAW
jgi:hypothetical protein